jgi:hypothetical protein
VNGKRGNRKKSERRKEGTEKIVNLKKREPKKE